MSRWMSFFKSFAGLCALTIPAARATVKEMQDKKYNLAFRTDRAKRSHPKALRVHFNFFREAATTWNSVNKSCDRPTSRGIKLVVVSRGVLQVLSRGSYGVLRCPTNTRRYRSVVKEVRKKCDDMSSPESLSIYSFWH